MPMGECRWSVGDIPQDLWWKLAGDCAAEVHSSFPGAHIITGTHYELCHDVMKDFRPVQQVYFYTLVAKPHGWKQKRTELIDGDPSVSTRVLTKSWRHGIVKSVMFWDCVKSLFRLAKLKWGELCNTFYRDERQQNYLVWIAMGVHNKLVHKSCNKNTDLGPTCLFFAGAWQYEIHVGFVIEALLEISNNTVDLQL